MWKFLAGVLTGGALAVGYVRYGIELPGALQISDRLKGNLISTATEAELYDLDIDAKIRSRALEVYFANRPADAAKLDAEAGHPFLEALWEVRARREARQLKGIWHAAEMALEKPAMRAALERKHGTMDTLALKRAMLLDGLERKPFLKRWMERRGGPVTVDVVADRVSDVAVLPERPSKR